MASAGSAGASVGGGAAALIFLQRLLRVLGTAHRLIRPCELEVHIAVFIGTQTRFELRYRLRVFPSQHVRFPQQCPAGWRRVGRLRDLLEDRNRAIDLLRLEQRIAVHQQQRAVGGLLACQSLEQRNRLVEVVGLQQGVR